MADSLPIVIGDSLANAEEDDDNYATPTAGSDVETDDNSVKIPDMEVDLASCQEQMMEQLTLKCKDLVAEMVGNIQSTIDVRNAEMEQTQATLRQQALGALKQEFQDSQTSLSEHLTGLSERLGESALPIQEDLRFLKEDIEQREALRERWFEEMTKNLAGMNDIHQEKLEAIRSDVHDRLTSIESAGSQDQEEKRATSDQLKRLEERLEVLEARFASDVVELDRKLEAERENAEGARRKLETGVDKLDRLVSTLEGSLGDLKLQLRSEIDGVLLKVGDFASNRSGQGIDAGKRKFAHNPNNVKPAATDDDRKSSEKPEAGVKPDGSKPTKKRYFGKRWYFHNSSNKNNARRSETCQENGGSVPDGSNKRNEASFPNSSQRPRATAGRVQTKGDECESNFSAKSHGIRKSVSENRNDEDFAEAEATIGQIIQDADANSADVFTNGVLLWKIDGFRRKFEEAGAAETSTYLTSIPFFTSPSPDAHKMRAHLSIKGDGIARGNHMSIFLEFVDDDTPTPATKLVFHHRVTYTLLDQSDDPVKRPVVRSYEPLFGCDDSERTAEIWGPNLFVPHALLLDHDDAGPQRYVLDDAICVMVEVLSMEQLFSDGHFSDNGILTWRVSDYHRNKQNEQAGIAHCLESEAFYDSVNGHRMRAMLFLNGLDDGRGSHASIFLGYFKGEHDAELTERPLVPHRIEFILRSQISNFACRDIVAFEVFDPEPGQLDTASRQRLNKLSGKFKFVEHSLLETEPYLMRDEIVIQVNVRPLTSNCTQ